MKPGLKILILGTLMTVPSLSDSVAKVTYSEKTIHYTVKGRTGQEIYSQISKKGPLLTGQPDHKVATTTMDFDVRWVDAAVKGNRCVVTRVDVHVDVVYRIPRWTGKGSAALRKAWAAFEAHLKALYHAAPDNKLYKVYMKRVAHFRESTPGPTWNGTWVFTTK